MNGIREMKARIGESWRYAPEPGTKVTGLTGRSLFETEKRSVTSQRFGGGSAMLQLGDRATLDISPTQVFASLATEGVRFWAAEFDLLSRRMVGLGSCSCD